MKSTQKPKIFYYSNELKDDFAGTSKIKTVELPKDYRYVSKNVFFHFFSWCLRYLIAWPVLNIGCRISHGVRVKNRKVLKKVKKQGYFIYSNHVVPTDCTYNNALLTTRRIHTVTHPDAVSIKGVKTIVQMLGGLPLGNSMSNSVAMMQSLKHLVHTKRHAILIYPEAHIWPYCTFIRRFAPVTLMYPVKLDAPIIVATTTFRKASFPFKKPRVTVHLDGPLTTNHNLSSKDAMEDLTSRIHQIMSEHAKNNVETGYQYIKVSEPTEISNLI